MKIFAIFYIINCIIKYKLYNRNSYDTNIIDLVSYEYNYLKLIIDSNEYNVKITYKSTCLFLFNKFISLRDERLGVDNYVKKLLECKNNANLKNKCIFFNFENIMGYKFKYKFNYYHNKSVESFLIFIDKYNDKFYKNNKDFIDNNNLFGVLGVGRNDLTNNYKDSFLDNLSYETRVYYPIFEMNFNGDFSYILFGSTVKDNDKYFYYYDLNGLLYYELKIVSMIFNKIVLKINDNFILDLDNYYCTLNEKLYNSLNEELCKLNNKIICESNILKQEFTIDISLITSIFKNNIIGNLNIFSEKKLNLNKKYAIPLYVICNKQGYNKDKIKLCLNFIKSDKNSLGNSFFNKKNIRIDKYINVIGINIDKLDINIEDKLGYNEFNESFYIIEFVQTILYYFIMLIFLILFYEITIEDS